MNNYIENCSEKDKDYILEKLVEYNISRVEAKQEKLFIDLSKKCLKNGKIVGGIVARCYCWKIVYIDILWVDPNFRKEKIGTTLLKYVEDESEKLGVTLIHLDTFDFQAKDFYEKHGYEVFGVLENCPDDHCRYYMKKKT